MTIFYCNIVKSRFLIQGAAQQAGNFCGCLKKHDQKGKAAPSPTQNEYFVTWTFFTVAMFIGTSPGFY